MYEYHHDCPFEAYITNLGKYNEGELVGEWVKFPTTKEYLKKVFQRIGIDEMYEEWFISDYDMYVSHLNSMALGEYCDLYVLNTLAQKIEALSKDEYVLFTSILQLEEYDNIHDILNILKELHRYDLLPIYSPKELGLCYMESIRPLEWSDLLHYIDVERLGEDLAQEEDGIFTENGYLRYA